MIASWKLSEIVASAVFQFGLGPLYLPRYFAGNSGDEEASFTTGHPIGLIYKDVNKGRKPLCLAYIQGLRFIVNGNIQLFSSWVRVDADEVNPGGRAHAARPAAMDYYVSTAWKTTIFRRLDLIQSCSVFKVTFHWKLKVPVHFFNSNWSLNAKCSIITSDFYFERFRLFTEKHSWLLLYMWVLQASVGISEILCS